MAGLCTGMTGRIGMLRPGTFALTALLAALTAVGPLSTDMYLPSLPDIARDLNASTPQVQLTISAFLVGFACGQILYGPVSDRLGRKPVLLTIAILSLVTAYPGLSWLAAGPTLGKLLAVQMMFSFYFGVYSGTMLGCLVEIVPAHVRTTCFSIAFALAAGIFGTSTPFVATKLIAITGGDKASPAFWLMFGASLGIIAALTVYRGGRTMATREAVTV